MFDKASVIRALSALYVQSGNIDVKVIQEADKYAVAVNEERGKKNLTHFPKHFFDFSTSFDHSPFHLGITVTRAQILERVPSVFGSVVDCEQSLVWKRRQVSSYYFCDTTFQRSFFFSLLIFYLHTVLRSSSFVQTLWEKRFERHFQSFLLMLNSNLLHHFWPCARRMFF